MKKLDCDNQSTDLKLPPCAGAFSTVSAKLMRLHHVEDEATALSDIRIMESAALKVMHKERAE